MSIPFVRRAKQVTKCAFIILLFISLSYCFSLLSAVHGSHLPEEYFSEGIPPIIGLLDSAFFMGVIFVFTISLAVYVIYLLWQLHEIAVHKAEKIKSKQANLVFALSLCGLFLHKAWWVVAVIIAFTNWAAISAGLSSIIRQGIKSREEESSV